MSEAKRYFYPVTFRYSKDADKVEDAAAGMLNRTIYSTDGTYAEHQADLKRKFGADNPGLVEAQRRSQSLMQAIDGVLASARMTPYLKDAWSRAGVAALKKLPREVPVGAAYASSYLTDDGVMALVEKDTRKNAPNIALFSGSVWGERLPAILRHEANHVVGAKDGNPGDNNYMDSFYGFRPIKEAPSTQALGRILDKAREYSERDPESIKHTGPNMLQTHRIITPEDLAMVGLTNNEYLQLVDAAHTYKGMGGIKGNAIRRSLPGDTIWGDFIRAVQSVTGEGDITESMKAWTETPDNQRAWYRK